MAASYGQMNGQHHHAHRPTRVVVVAAPRPHHAVPSRAINHRGRKERLAMAIAYLTRYRKLTAKQYAKMTSLNKHAAETELDAFVLDRKNPIQAIFDGKNKIYIMHCANS